MISRLLLSDANLFPSSIGQGTSIRRTNETEMNAQSSRSHAIFSLTLTQKKFTGSGPPPRSVFSPSTRRSLSITPRTTFFVYLWRDEWY